MLIHLVRLVVYVKLNGTNCCMWKKMMTAHLCGLNKMGYVYGTIETPEEDAEAYPMWENSMLMVLPCQFFTKL